MNETQRFEWYKTRFRILNEDLYIYRNMFTTDEDNIAWAIDEFQWMSPNTTGLERLMFGRGFLPTKRTQEDQGVRHTDLSMRRFMPMPEDFLFRAMDNYWWHLKDEDRNPYFLLRKLNHRMNKLNADGRFILVERERNV